MKLMIIPQYSKPDKADGGIRRVVEAQIRHLPKYGFEIVDRIVRADIVCTHGIETGDIPVDKPWVCHNHGLMWAEYIWPGWADRINCNVVDRMKKCDHVTAPSKWVAYALKRGMWLRPTVLHHGIDPELWEPGNNQGYVLWNKARKDAISDPAPIEKLARLCPDMSFVSTFGTPSTNLRITGKKVFDEAREEIKHAEVYLATTRETFGIGTLEAMACGVPVLGWNWGGQVEIIKHKETGWLAPVGNYESLKEGLLWCIENRKAIGDAARTDVMERFTWEKVMGSYAELYHSVYERHLGLSNGPKVSLIVPCHNLGHLLPDMVNSVLDQTMQNWEMIIVDDKSEDDSFEVAMGFAKKDKRIGVYSSEENLKLPGSLNFGFSLARGRYIMNLDPDNMIPPSTLKVLSDALDNDRSIHLAYGRIKFVLEDGITPDPITQTEDGISGWPPEFNCANQFRHRNQIPSTCLARREIFERTGGYRMRAKVAEDAEFWTRVVSYGFQPKKVTEAVTYIYRYRSDSKSRDETEPDWTAWLPWTKDIKLVPWGVATNPPKERGRFWPVPSCEPALVTIIIPVGPGHDKVVIDALDSVEAQTFRNWACIVINDTGKELKVPHPWVQIIETNGEEGPSVARNLGIATSVTQAFVCLDADDIMQPDCLKEMWNVWKREKGIVYSQWFDDKGDIIELWDPPEWDPKLLITDGCIHASCAMYAKSAWLETGGFDPVMKNWEDWDFQIAYVLKGFCATKINKPLFTYRKITGHRREEAAADKMRGEKEMRKKWPDMWDGNGKEKLAMACAGCGKKRIKQARPSPPRQVVNIANDSVTLLEYHGSSPKSLWVGKVTNKKYYFGSDINHRRMFVYNDDVEDFLSLGGMFKIVGETKVVNPEKPVLSGIMEG